MERVAALALTTRISNTWTEQPWPGARIDTWIDALLPLDEGRAGTTWARLRGTEQRCPSIAAFLAQYSALTTDRPEHHPDCPICDNHGWEYLTHTDADGIERVQGVRPCRCPHGRRYDEPHRTAIDHNDNELARLGLTRHTNQHQGAA